MFSVIPALTRPTCGKPLCSTTSSTVFTGFQSGSPKPFPRELLESTKLVKFERYAEFTVAGLAEGRLQLWATGQRPHYDVVYEGNDLESLVARLAAAPHRIVDNPGVDREEH